MEQTQRDRPFVSADLGAEGLAGLSTACHQLARRRGHGVYGARGKPQRAKRSLVTFD